MPSRSQPRARRRRAALGAVSLLWALSGICTCEATPTPTPTTTQSSSPTAIAEAASARPPLPPDPPRCKPSPGVTGSPNTIEEAVALANSLPFPVTAECFVEALDRPLRVEATRSKNSVQPAEGERSPRIFLWTTDALVIAIVIDGEKRDLVEFSQFVAPKRSVKAELLFPLRAPATAAMALDRVRNPEHPNITTCFVCHDNERDEPSVPGGRSSVALRPRPSTLVDVDTLRAEHRACDATSEPDRCRWLEALVGHGPLEHRPFADDLSLF